MFTLAVVAAAVLIHALESLVERAAQEAVGQGQQTFLLLELMELQTQAAEGAAVQLFPVLVLLATEAAES